VWTQEVVWLPADCVRTYGPLTHGVRAAFGVTIPRGRTPLLLHPQPPASHRRLRRQYGSIPLAGVTATPTASYRTVLARAGDRPPVMLKLSMGARVGRLRRAITEYYLVTGIVVSHLLGMIPAAQRRRLGFDWFPEPAGAVETDGATGWMLREFPAMMFEQRAGDLVPVFSLIAPRGDRPPMLVDMIRQSGMRPEAFIVEKLLLPYVGVMAHLLLDEGVQLQGHAQNVLVEVHAETHALGRIVLRDLTDSSVNLALRLAKGKPLPAFERGFLPATTPFPVIRSVTDHAGSAERHRPIAASDTVEKYGLKAFVWSINTSLARYFKRYDAHSVERHFLVAWQDEVKRHLRVDPELSTTPWGLATDEALAYYLAHVDWASAGSRRGITLPASAEPLPSGKRFQRRAGPVYDCVESHWGDLYLDRGRPVAQRPAF
jgi:hypothetical protein